jgi:cytochrome b
MDPWRDPEYVRSQETYARRKQVSTGSIVAAGLSAGFAWGPWGCAPTRTQEFMEQRAARRKQHIQRMLQGPAYRKPRSADPVEQV